MIHRKYSLWLELYIGSNNRFNKRHITLPGKKDSFLCNEEIFKTQHEKCLVQKIALKIEFNIR